MTYWLRPAQRADVLRTFGMSMSDKLIVALDVDSLEKATALVNELRDYAGAFKVGKELFTRAGFQIVKTIQEKGSRVFLDLKYHDIPTTVRGAARAASDLGVSFFTVHASGGSEMLKAAAEGVCDSGREDVISLAVTVLTSIDEERLKGEMKVAQDLAEHVLHLAKLAQNAGLKGVVASPREIRDIRQACGSDFVIVTPGVRPDWAGRNDQQRTLTPRAAIEAGANYIVIGRPITQAADPKKAARRILEEM